MAMKKRKRIPWGWILVALLVVGGGGGGLWYQQNSAARAAELPKGVQTGTAQRGDLDRKITATGVVAAQIGAKVNIGAEITGRILSLPADVGSRVGRGQIVASLSSPDLEAQVQQSQQNVHAQEASLAQAQSRLRQAELTAGLSEAQTAAQIAEADFALRAAGERLRMSEASSQMQPTQTASEIARARAALSTARSQEKQVQQTVALQIQQSEASVQETQAALTRVGALRRRQEALLAQGFVAPQDVDDTRAEHRQMQARLQNAQAALRITREKTSADLQAARDQVLQAEANLEAAESGKFQDQMREAERRSADQTMRQAQASLNLRRTSKTEDVIRRRAVEEARSAVRQAQAGLKQAQAALRYQQAQLNKAVIRSPIDGTVLSIAAQQGETVTAGFQTPTLITVANLRRLEVRAYVDEVDIGRVRLGLPVEVRVESFPDRVFAGRVTKIAGASTVKDNVVTYETTVAIDNRDGLLFPDMTADVTVILGRLPDVLYVPSESVHREVTRSIVYILHRKKQGKERVEIREVVPGFDDGSRTEIKSGLKEGDEVVLAGLPRLGVKAADAQMGPSNKKDEE